MDIPVRSPVIASARRKPWLTVLVLANLAALLLLGVVTVHRYEPVDRLQLALGIGFPERMAEPMLIIAHRGDLDQYPEDTLEAIEAAAAGSADGIEFDVHRSADGVWYVIHDPTLDRTTDLTGPVHEARSEEIDEAQIDGGLGFRPEHTGLTVPRLEAVLHALGDYDGSLIVDLQHRWSGDAGEAVSLLDGRNATVLVQGVQDIEAVKAVDPQLTTVTRNWVASGDRDGILMEAVDEATIGRVRGAGQPVWTYIDGSRFDEGEERTLERAWAANVHAFITKHPESAMEAVTRIRAAETQTLPPES